MRRVSAWYDARRGGRTVVTVWLVSRALVLLMLTTKVEKIGDVYYYYGKIRELVGAVNLQQTMNEYPTPVVWILTMPYAAALGSRTGYVVAFIILMLALDAVFVRALYVTGGPRHDRAIDFWLLFVLLIGPLSYVRFDMLPAVLAGGALLAARRRPWVTGALTGLGAALKLWPALLIPAFLTYRRDRKPAGLAFVVVGFGLALVSLVFGGFRRLVSPLTWQSDRGLQVESIWATPLMVARAIRPSTWIVKKSDFQAYEIFGPGVSAWLTVSNIVTVAGLLAIVGLLVLAFRAGGASPIAIGMVIMATVAIMIVSNKTLSPQYLLWLDGPAAAMLLLRREAKSTERRAIFRIALQLLALALLTHLVYPLLYDGLLGTRGHTMIIISTAVTAVRNLALLVFTVEVCAFAWRSLRFVPQVVEGAG